MNTYIESMGAIGQQHLLAGFCLKLPTSSRKPIKRFLHFKMLTLQNVKFEMSEYSNMTYIILSIYYEKCID